MIQAILRELVLQSTYLKGEVIDTIYFGGGTPSALPSTDILRIVQTVRNHYPVASNAEITLEANPDDLHEDPLIEWKEAGINRLSIGIQAFQEDLLRNWDRSHSSVQALESISAAQQAGFENITADLIYGGPGLSDENWEKNIQLLIDSGIPHISSYALTVEVGTALFHQIKKGTSASPDDEQAGRQYAILQSMLDANGFLQYEVSNFSKPGFESKHNMSYWSGAHYLGIGPSAHSYNGKSRQWNIANNIKYILAIEEDVIPFESETLTSIQRYNEIVMTGLRTSAGIDRKRIQDLDGSFLNYLDLQIEGYVKKEQVVKNEFGNWTLKPHTYFFADGIAADLFFTDSTTEKP